MCSLSCRRGTCDWVMLLLLLLLLLLFRRTTAAVTSPQQEVEDVVTFSPEALLEVVDGTNHVVRWFSNTTWQVDRVWTEMEDLMVAEVTWLSEAIEGVPEEDNMTDYRNVTYHGYINISALFLGYNNLHVILYDKDNVSVATGTMEMTVLLSYQNITDIFTILLAVLIGVLYFFMGATLDLQVVKGIIKKPVGPVVGVLCQYGFMPMIAFGLGLVIFPDDALLRLGLFLSGSCPGGGASNMWTHLLGGSLDLSIMMTAVSTLASFAAVPLWVLLMGPIILREDANFVIPYSNITITVISLIIPCGLGLLFQVFLPKTVKYCEKVITPLSSFNIIFTFTFGVYSYLYIFSLFTWRMLAAGFALPMLGYLAGMMLAKLCRMPTEKVIAISVETGVQNYTIALIILQMTLESPAGELSAVMPGASTLFTPLPLVVVLIIKKIYDHVNRGRTLDISSSPAKNIKEGPADVRDTPMATLEKTGRLENGIKLPAVANGGIDNPAADLRDTV